MPMSEEDEVFLEKSFQRTLIVYSPRSPLHLSLLDYEKRRMKENPEIELICRNSRN
jgi:hypothetical protein